MCMSSIPHRPARSRPWRSDGSELPGKGLARLIGETPEMQRLRKNIRRLSELDCPIVIHGETGTG